MTEPREVVWSDEKIAKMLSGDGVGAIRFADGEHANKVAQRIRDDLRATIDAQAQEIATLRGELATVRAELNTLTATRLTLPWIWTEIDNEIERWREGEDNE